MGVSSYAVWRNEARIGETTGTTYTDHSAWSGATYTYAVTAYDSIGNVSPASNPVTVTIRGSGKGGGGKNKPK